MNPKQARFVVEYLIDLNGTQAAIRAGYSKRTANEQAARLLAKADIQEAVQKGREEQSKRLEITADAVVLELARIGFANMGDYMVAGPGGDPHLDFSKLTRDQTAALVEVTVEDFLDGRGEDARAVRRVKFKLADKHKPLVDLGRHLGIFKPERHEVTGKDGAPLTLPPIVILPDNGRDRPDDDD